MNSYIYWWMKIYFASYLLLFSLDAHSRNIDSTYQEGRPKGGINELALLYYGIEFTKEQREKIEGVEVEYIFEVDETGKARLVELNGISDAAVVDSLMSKNKEMVEFYPSIKNGIAISSIYFMKMTFPSYQHRKSAKGLWMADTYREAKLEDFEVLEKANRRLDIVIGGAVNQFIGSPSEYLKIGGGMKTDITYTNKHLFYCGLLMDIYFNGRKKDYPIASTREQHPSVSSIAMGLVLGKWYDKFGVQLQLGFAAQNVTEKLDDSDKDWVQFRGFSPGLVVHYPIKFGRDKPYYYYGTPTIYSNYVNFHFGVRQWFLSEKEASGLMLELGLGYRLVVHGVKEYKFRKEYLERF